MPRFVALIPARAGSKGIENKNTQVVGGLTLIQHAVAAAFKAGLTEVFLSSDSTDILSSCQSANPNLQTILRKQHAATDSARAADVVFDFLDQQESLKASDFIVYLQPTSPLRSFQHIREAISLIQAPDKLSVVSVVEASPHPFKAVSILDSKIEVAFGSATTANRQTMPQFFFPNGAVYIFTVGEFLELGDVPIRGATYLKMDKISSIDIDSPEDLLLARLIWEHGHFGSS